MTIRIPSPVIASPTGTSMVALGGQELLGEDDDGDHGHPDDTYDTQRHEHQHQSDARADAQEPELEPRMHALATVPAEVPFERCELVDPSSDRERPRDERSVWPVQRVHGDADECHTAR